MKRISLALCMLTIGITLFGCTKTETTISDDDEEDEISYDINYTCPVKFKNKTLYVLNWGDYMDPKLYKTFEEKCKVKVVYEEATSNETMRTNLLSGKTKYDILMPSDWMVDFLNQEGKLAEINKTLIPNFNNLNEKYLNLPYDLENSHSVPYFWGTVGLIYNKNRLLEVGIKPEELNDWNILWDNRFGANNILIYESVRDIFMFALKSDNKSANTIDKAEIDAARDKLIELNRINKLKFATDTIKMDVVDGNAVIGVTFNGDFLNMYSELKANHSEINIGWAIPNQGTNKWYDNFVIPTISENKELAHEFINFFLNAKVAYLNAIYVGYSTPNKAAVDYLRKDEVFKELVALDAYEPEDTILNVSEAYIYPGDEIFDYYNNSFEQFRNKTGSKANYMLFIVVGVIIVSVVGVSINKKIKKY